MDKRDVSHRSKNLISRTVEFLFPFRFLCLNHIHLSHRT